MPQGGPLAWLEIVLLMVLAVQLARLFWVIATPVGPLGNWQPTAPAAMTPAARHALLARFDPFYRGQASGEGSAAVTSLSLKLFGIRLNEASGQGSAIIATPDGMQSSVAVGGEIMPGVKLKEVAIDHVVIDRQGVAETLYLDQSAPAPTANPGRAPPAALAALRRRRPNAASASHAASPPATARSGRRSARG